MEPNTIIERLNSEVLDYFAAGTHDRETLQRFSLEYVSLLEHAHLSECPHCTDEMAPGFSLLITELEAANDTFTETETGLILWKVVLDCWTALGTQHSDLAALTKTFNELVLYTFNENYRNVWNGIHIHTARVLKEAMTHKSSY